MKLTKLINEIFEGSKLAEVGGVISLPATGQKKTEPATPPAAATPGAAPTTSAQVYNASAEMQSFESEVAASIAKHEQNFKARLLNKTVTVRAAKGYGQVEKDHTIVVTSVAIVLFKETYHLVLKDKEKKEYYVNVNTKIKIS